MKKIAITLAASFTLALTITALLAVSSFRQSGPILHVRLVLALLGFIAWGAWLLFSLLAIPRSIAAWRRARNDGRSIRPALLTLLAGAFPFVAAAFLALVAPRWSGLRMPGASFRGNPPPLTDPQAALRDELRRDVRWLSLDLGERNALFSYTNLNAAADGIRAAFTNAGWSVRTVDYTPDHWATRGRMCRTIEAEHHGRMAPETIVVIGAHYDTVDGTPGADDNASGVATLLALARRLATWPPDRTLRLVAFVNEEPPFFFSRNMGSYVYAAECRKRGDSISAMLSIESVGRYSDLPDSQRYPTPLLARVFPTTGNFIGFIGNTPSRQLVWDALGSFRRHTQFPSEGAALPGLIAGVGWSDHWAFWQFGYPAIMVTDTAPFRNAQYHQAGDTWDRLDYERLARVADGLVEVVRDLAGPVTGGG